MVSSQLKNKIRKLWLNPKYGFKGAISFNSFLRFDRGINVSLKTVYQILHSIKSYVYHKKTQKPKKLRKYQVDGGGILYEADLAFLPKDPSTNAIGFLAVCDVWNLNVWAFPIKSKKPEELKPLFKKIFKENGYTPQQLQTDFGNVNISNVILCLKPKQKNLF